MSLKSEIQALRAEIDAHARKAPAAEEGAASAAGPETLPSGEAHDRQDATQQDIEAFLKTVNETLDAFAEELDKYPRLGALAALGVGLAAGIVIGRQSR
jgi:hypothetical protein